MKKVFSLILALVLSFVGYSQSCYVEIIDSQTQIDSFQFTYPNCTHIEGDLRINGANITNLDSLSVVTSIGHNLKILYCDDLTSLEGLNNLTYIGENLYIEYNNSLTDLAGLDNVNFIGENVNIVNNFNLTSLAGLSASLTSFGGDLVISNNHTLNNLTGLSSLTSIGGELLIYDNDGLTNLSGLEYLVTVGDSTGEGNIDVAGNLNLTSLSGLNNLNAGSMDNLYIAYNESLSTCDVQSVCDYLASPSGVVEIHDNAAGCSSQAEVEAACRVGLEESAVSSRKSAVIISPNPTSANITIELASTIPVNSTIIAIYDVNAKQVISRRITEPQTVVDISALPCGVYFMRISGEKEVMTGKFIKH